MSRAVAVYALAAVLMGCASGQRGKAAGTTAPSLVSTVRPELRYPSRPQSGRVLDLQIEVAVNAAGVPDPATLRVTGLGAAENREVIESWLEQARFRPARQGGQPVPGTYRTRIQVRAEVRRVS